VRIFKNTWFTRFARKEGIADDELREAVNQLEAGQFDADLGGGVFKQRIAREGEGKSGGYRAIVLLKSGDRSFFVYGFAKSDRDNIDQKDTRDYKKLAKYYFRLPIATIEKALKTGKLVEV
jgi:hypothetical protein